MIINLNIFEQIGPTRAVDRLLIRPVIGINLRDKYGHRSRRRKDRPGCLQAQAQKPPPINMPDNKPAIHFRFMCSSFMLLSSKMLKHKGQADIKRNRMFRKRK